MPGLGDEAPRSHPELVKEYPNDNGAIKSVHAGPDCSLLLSASGLVCCAGNNEENKVTYTLILLTTQLGLNYIGIVSEIKKKELHTSGHELDALGRHVFY